MGAQVRRDVAAVSDRRAAGRRWQLRAWVALALIPVGLLAAMVVGEALLAAQGFEVGSDTAPPLGPMLLAAVPALLVGVTAPVAAVWCGLLADRHGHRHGRRVAIAAAIVAVGFVLLNAAAAIVGR